MPPSTEYESCPARAGAEPVASWLAECHQKLVGCPATPVTTAETPRLYWTTARELGVAMLAYASNTNDHEVFDRAILLLQQAHDDGPADGDPLAQNSYQLGLALFARHRRYGRPSDLDATIAVLEDVRYRLPARYGTDNSRYAALCLGLLATALRSEPSGAGSERSAALSLLR